MGTSGLTLDEQTTLDHILGDLRLYHDPLQLRSFILGAEGQGTIWGIYRQCLRELDSRRCTIQGRVREIATARIELGYARACSRAWAFTAKGRRACALAVLDAEKYQQALDNLEYQLAEVRREFTLLLEVGRSCKAKLGTITEESRAKLDRHFWEEKFVRQAVLSIMTTGTIDAGLLTLLAQLPQTSFEVVCNRIDVATPDGHRIVGNLSRMRSGARAVDDDGTGITTRAFTVPSSSVIELEAAQ